MSNRGPDFIRGFPASSRDKKSKNRLELFSKEAVLDFKRDCSSVITTNTSRIRKKIEKINFADDGLYASSESPLTSKIVKPYPLEHNYTFSKNEEQISGKLLEVIINDVKIFPNERTNKSPEVNNVALIYKQKVICKTNQPFDRKLHRLFIRNSLDANSLMIQVEIKNGQQSALPLLIPERSIKNKKIEIEFAVKDNEGLIYSGNLMGTLSMEIKGMIFKNESNSYLYTPSTNDPNDPRNSDSLLKPITNKSKNQVQYFLLQDPGLTFPSVSNEILRKIEENKNKHLKQVNIAVAEKIFKFSDFSLRRWLQEKKPFAPPSGVHTQKHIGRRQILTVTVLRGVEVPVREESALVQPIIEVEWGDVTQSTVASDGPAPIWQQTMQFEVPALKSSTEHSVTLRLFDQHPVWGLQWLGDAKIPIECHSNYQELERWIGLSPLCSPVISFGYIQASPGFSYTRIYVLMKMEQIGITIPEDNKSINALCKSIQRCLAAPYKIPDIESTNDAAKLVMLMESLPVHYGPLTPRQALNLNKVDHYGRSALLATLLEGFGLQTFVILGSSQIRKWAAFTITIQENNKVTLWDSENGDHYDLDDNRCALIDVSRMINHQSVWENTAKNIPPPNLKYDPKISNDWQLILGNTSASGTHTQTVELNIAKEEEIDEQEITQEIEQTLKENLTQWRTQMELPTIFNRHADTILREILSKTGDSVDNSIDRTELIQLYRAYYTHGFIINLRYTNIENLSNFLFSTKIHAMSGPIEFALICYVKKYVGKIRSIWLAVVILRNRNL